jgi:hypothetical protein
VMQDRFHNPARRCAHSGINGASRRLIRDRVAVAGLKQRKAPPATASGEAFRIDGLSDVPHFGASPTVGVVVPCRIAHRAAAYSPPRRCRNLSDAITP